MTLVLASNSPRRKQLLQLGGWEFRVVPAEIDEQLISGEAPEIYVRRLAEEKARAAVARLSAGQDSLVVVAADTTVAQDGVILGKPENPAEAEAMLSQLRGRVHQVHTGVSVLHLRDGRQVSDVCTTDVRMRLYTAQEVAAYVASGDPLDKAGAYAIQNTDFHPVEKIQGCYTNVVGLPLCCLQRLLAQVGVGDPDRLPQVCREYAGQEGCAFQPDR